MKWPFHTTDTRIIDRTRLRTVPERHALHVLYWLLYICAVIAALWQHGHSRLVLVLLVTSVPMAALAYLPYRYFSGMMRIWLALGWGGATCVWSFRQFQSGILLDQVLIEVVACLAQLFLMGQRGKDYGFLFLSCLFMMIYGALLPREVFLVVLAGATVILLLILYGHRSKSLSGNPKLTIPPRTIRRNWHFFLVHMGLATIFFWIIFSLIPIREATQEGFFGVSFLTDKEQIVTESIQKWLNPGKQVTPGTSGKQIIRTGASPTVFNPQGTPMQIKNAKSTTASQNGDGSAMGQDLVFRVKSPVKLYHLACLFDSYDGLNWKTTPQLLRQTDTQQPERFGAEGKNHTIEIGYIIEKWNSPRLYAPFRPISFSPGPVNVFIKSNLYSGWLRGDTYPELPFRYAVTSKLYLPTEDGKDKSTLYVEKLQPKHYLALPKKKISNRLRRLTEEIVRDAETPYAKAIALRDYLRNNCTYKLHSSQTPKGKEPVDYFVFELKEGHCEYFAAAMTVMARLAGLPARVATGFSPGNYNTLTNLFEVYEYHAHAWSQVFVENYGWLTLDAVPPGNVPSETKPLGIGRLRDPFGDEWRIVPPEVTPQIQKFIKEAALMESREKMEETAGSPAQQLLSRAAFAEERIRDKIQSLRPPREKGAHADKNAPRPLGKRLSELLYYIFVHYPAVHWRMLLPFPLMLLSVWLLIRMLSRARSNRLLRHIIEMSMQEAERQIGKDNNATVRLTLRAMLAMLPLADLPRRKNQELILFARTQPAAVAELLLPVCQIYYQVEYSGSPASSTEAESALAACNQLKETLTL